MLFSQIIIGVRVGFWCSCMCFIRNDNNHLKTPAHKLGISCWNPGQSVRTEHLPVDLGLVDFQSFILT